MGSCVARPASTSKTLNKRPEIEPSKPFDFNTRIFPLACRSNHQGQARTIIDSNKLEKVPFVDYSRNSLYIKRKLQCFQAKNYR